MRPRASRLAVIVGVLAGAAVAAAAVLIAGGASAIHSRRALARAYEGRCPRGQIAEHDSGSQATVDEGGNRTAEADKRAAGHEPDAGCQRIGHPESFADLMRANSSLVTRAVAPNQTLRTGAYRHAIAQRARIASDPASAAAASDGSWVPIGTTPLVTDNTTYDQSSGSTQEGFVNVSGRVTDYAHASNGAIFAAASNGGIWQSDDSGGHWRSIADALPTQVVSSVDWSPAQGGTILVMTGDNAFGFDSAAGLGAYRSTDDGAHWQKAAGVPDGVLGFRIAVDPTNPNVVYAATGDGLFRSTDDGASFTNVDLPTGSCHGDSSKKDCFLANMVTDVVVQGAPNAHGGTGGAVLAAVGWRAGTKTNADGAVQSPSNGIYTSSTGAPGSFSKVDTSASGFAGGSQTAIGRVALGIANGPDQNHQIVYALVEDANKFDGKTVPDTLDEVPTGAPGSTVLNGVWESSDFGQHWTELESSTVLNSDVTSGSALEPAGKGLSYEPGVQAWYNEWIEPDPTLTAANGAPQRVVFGLEELWENDLTPLSPTTGATTPSTFRVIGRYWNSCDFEANGAPKCGPGRGNGSTQANTTTTHPDQHGGMWVPDGSGGVTLVAGNDGGTYTQHVAQGGDLSNNGWGDGAQAGLHTLQPYDAEVAKDGTVYMGMQDNGEGKILPDGRQFEIYGGDGFFTGVDPSNSNYAYEEYSGGLMSATTDGGQNWVNIDPALTSAQFSTPFVVDPNNPKHILIGGRDIRETTYGADTGSDPTGSNAWQKVFDLGTQKHAGDASAADSTSPTGDPTDPNNQLSAVDLRGDAAYVGYCGFCDTITQPVTPQSPFQNGIATNLGGDKDPHLMTSDGWHIAKAAGLPDRYITDIAMNPQNESQVFVTLGGYGRRWAPPGAVGDETSRIGKGHLFVSDDAGQSFRDISGDLPDAPANWIVIHGGRLVVATDIGVFQSDNLNGGHYGLLGAGLPIAPINHLVLQQGSPDTMIASTYGRGVYRFTFSNRAPAGSPSSNQTGCGDVLAPRTSLSKHGVHASRSRVRITGRSIDRKCRTGVKVASFDARVPKVQVFVARTTGTGKHRKCRFLGPNGRLGPARGCSRPKWLNARVSYDRKRHKTDWVLDRRHLHLPGGIYLAEARGVDRFGHVERQLRKYNRARFRIR